MATRLRLLLALVAVAAAVFVAAPIHAAHTAVDTGVVDVNTKLGFAGGSAAGTGMLLTPSGEVLTNNHVIRGATAIRVRVPSTGRSYTATVVGYSVANDIAVLALHGAANLETVGTGNSSAVKIGQKVTAVGNAGGVGGRPIAATGTITGVGRTITATDDEGISEKLTGLIRTDAALKPGDSGGPLESTAGTVIGMDTAASVGFHFQASGDGYAIPINKALKLVRQIAAGRAGATVHIGSTPFLGLSVPSQDNAPTGVTVASVVPGGPADQAGLTQGETITTIDGRSVNSFKQLTSALLRYAAGTKVTLGVINQTGLSSTVSVKTAAGPPQ